MKRLGGAWCLGGPAEKGTGIVPGSAGKPEESPEIVPSPPRVSAPREPSGQQKNFVAHPTAVIFAISLAELSGFS